MKPDNWMGIQRIAVVLLKNRQFYAPLVLEESEPLHRAPLVEQSNRNEGVAKFLVQVISRNIFCLISPAPQRKIEIIYVFFHEIHNQLRVINQEKNGKDSGSIAVGLATDKLGDIRATVPQCGVLGCCYIVFDIVRCYNVI